MTFDLVWLETANEMRAQLQAVAEAALAGRQQAGKTKTSPPEGLFKQVMKTISLLAENPRHPSLQTHEYSSIANPYRAAEKVFEAYGQNRTPVAYGVFWCYGPGAGSITIIAITPHP